jgi:hypothetical protein
VLKEYREIRVGKDDRAGKEIKAGKATKESGHKVHKA